MNLTFIVEVSLELLLAVTLCYCIVLERRLRAAIALLNPAAAQIVILRYVHDYDLAEIARMLGTTRSTVAVSLFRSRSHLRKHLLKAQKGGDHAPR